MTKAQTKLIKQAATKEVDGGGFRRRMDAWLEMKPRPHQADYMDWGALTLLALEDVDLNLANRILK